MKVKALFIALSIAFICKTDPLFADDSHAAENMVRPLEMAQTSLWRLDSDYRNCMERGFNQNICSIYQELDWSSQMINNFQRTLTKQILPQLKAISIDNSPDTWIRMQIWLSRQVRLDSKKESEQYLKGAIESSNYPGFHDYHSAIVSNELLFEYASFLAWDGRPGEGLKYFDQMIEGTWKACQGSVAPNLKNALRSILASNGQKLATAGIDKNVVVAHFDQKFGNGEYDNLLKYKLPASSGFTDPFALGIDHEKTKEFHQRLLNFAKQDTHTHADPIRQYLTPIPGDVVILKDAAKSESIATTPTSTTITADYAVPSGNKNKDMAKPYLTELLKLKARQGGRDNALIHYTVASWYEPEGYQHPDLMKKTLAEGWSAESASLVPLFTAYQPMFAEIRKGAALNYACNIGFGFGSDLPAQNFGSSQKVAEMMCCEGLYRQSKGDYEGAMDDFVTVLTMGRDYAASGTTVFGAVFSCALQNPSLLQIKNIATIAPLSSDLLERMLLRVKEAEKGKAPLKDIVVNEFEWTGRCVQDMRAKLLSNTDKEVIEMSKEKDFQPAKEKFLREYDNIVSQRHEAKKRLLEEFSIPYSKRDPGKEKELYSFIEKAGTFMYGAEEDFETDRRLLLTQAHFGEAELALALADFKIQNQHYPKELSELAPKWFDQLPTDPFGEGFIYEPNAELSSYKLFSVGPDRNNDQGGICYDPTNGIMSSGDVVLKAPASNSQK